MRRGFCTLVLFILVIISCILMELHAKNYRIVKVLWRPFKTILSKVNITAVSSDGVFRALASFIFLSNISVLSATYQVGGSISIYNSIGVFQRKVVYTDPTTDWPSHKSTTYVLKTAVPFISVSLIPSVLLCIYPTRVYRYLSRFLSARKRLAITAFAEALHSCFKDGLNGTRDYRSLAGASVFLILGIVVVESIINLLFNFSAFITGGVMWLILVCVVSYVKPCKSALANISLVFHTTLLGALTYAIHLWQYDLSVGTNTLEPTITAILLAPHILVAAWVGYTLTKHTLTRFGYQFHGPGCNVALSDITKGVRLCLCLYRRWRGYQELEIQ